MKIWEWGYGKVQTPLIVRHCLYNHDQCTWRYSLFTQPANLAMIRDTLSRRGLDAQKIFTLGRHKDTSYHRLFCWHRHSIFWWVGL